MLTFTHVYTGTEARTFFSRCYNATACRCCLTNQCHAPRPRHHSGPLHRLQSTGPHFCASSSSSLVGRSWRAGSRREVARICQMVTMTMVCSQPVTLLRPQSRSSKPTSSMRRRPSCRSCSPSNATWPRAPRCIASGQLHPRAKRRWRGRRPRPWQGSSLRTRPRPCYGGTERRRPQSR